LQSKNSQHSVLELSIYDTNDNLRVKLSREPRGRAPIKLEIEGDVVDTILTKNVAEGGGVLRHDYKTKKSNIRSVWDSWPMSFSLYQQGKMIGNVSENRWTFKAGFEIELMEVVEGELLVLGILLAIKLMAV